MLKHETSPSTEVSRSASDSSLAEILTKLALAHRIVSVFPFECAHLTIEIVRQEEAAAPSSLQIEVDVNVRMRVY